MDLFKDETLQPKAELSENLSPKIAKRTELVSVAKPRLLWKSQCFIEIIKLFYKLHDDIAPYDLAKLQLLNKKCYDYFVPRAMEELQLKFEMVPCLISTFEPEI